MGINKLSITETEGRFIENLQDVAMSSGPIDSEIKFVKKNSTCYFN